MAEDRYENTSREQSDNSSQQYSRRPQNKKRFFKRRFCYFTKNNIQYIDYKDVELLKRFIKDGGKIVPRRLSGTSAKYQRMLSRAIKKARAMALLPYKTRID